MFTQPPKSGFFLYFMFTMVIFGDIMVKSFDEVKYGTKQFI